MMKKIIALLLTIGVLVLAACDSTANVERADEIEDVLGTWQRVGATIEMFCRNAEDGTQLCADSVVELDNNSGFLSDYWFEGNRYHEQSRTACQAIGIYEALLLENGNIKYELIEDECQERVSIIVGSFDSEGKIEWAPVP